ncbi:MAG: Mpo1-like protein, partial [Burkholderiales bacterium]
MRTANQVLTQYAAYHRDRRNIATHFVGVPIIVFSVVLALAQVVIGPVHLGWVGIILATSYYLALDRPLGFLMFGFLVLCGA